MLEILYTPKDVRRIRDVLNKAQNNVEPIILTEIKNPCLDHDHKTCLVRGVLQRESNVFEGIITRAFNRYLKHNTSLSLSEILLNLVEYYKKHSKEEAQYLHPGWIKKSKTEFNKLNEKQKAALLKSMNLEDASNSAERKKIFAKALTSKKFNFDEIKIKIKEIS